MDLAGCIYIYIRVYVWIYTHTCICIKLLKFIHEPNRSVFIQETFLHIFFPNFTKKVRHFLLIFLLYICLYMCSLLAAEARFSFSEFCIIKQEVNLAFSLYMSPLPLLNIRGSPYITFSRSAEL